MQSLWWLLCICSHGRHVHHSGHKYCKLVAVVFVAAVFVQYDGLHDDQGGRKRDDGRHDFRGHFGEEKIH